MGWNQSIFPLIIIPSGSPNTGLFVYNGPPAKGNLVAAIVAPGVTTDPYGNHVSAVFNAGTWNASGNLLQHFGVDSNGDIYLASSTGATIVRGHSANGALWFYNASGQGVGNLLSSIAPVAGTDVPGNAVVQGIAAYAAGSPATNVQMTAGGILFNQSAVTAAASIGSNSSAALNLSTGTTAGNTVEAIFVMGPGATGGAGNTELFGSALELQEIPVIPPADSSGLTAGPKFFGNTSGHVGVVADSLHGDGNTYDVERLFLHGTALPQSIASTTATTITGCSKTNLGLGRYRYKAYISFHGAGAVGTARFCVAGTLVTSSFDIAAMFITNTGVANNGTSSTFGSTGFVQSPTLTVGANIAYIEGEFVVSTAGSVLLQAFEGTAGDAFTVDNCKFDLFPVVAS